ncbi:MAG: hypothetical protein COA42_19335 [Alteromonadaceae bacterium]|nr:MAG: hypothetical protein COA42_19335 [Alteromonadaceae bacterium]
MANFKTHLQFSTIGSGLASTLFLNGQFITAEDTILCWVAGSFAGILPDLDSDNSHSLAILFGLLSIVACAATVLYGVKHWPLLQVWGAGVVTFAAVNLLIRPTFERFTVHRGIFHSVLGAIFTGLLVAIISQKCGLSPTSSWFIASFTSFGFLLHLILDEIYAVEFTSISVKRSFGTAFKIFDYGNWKTALGLSMGIAALCFFLPPSEDFLGIMLDSETYKKLLSGVYSV